MAIIRYPDSSEELHRSVLFGLIIRVLVHLKFSAGSSTKKFVYFRYHCLCYITAINLSDPTDFISCSVFQLVLM